MLAFAALYQQRVIDVQGKYSSIISITSEKKTFILCQPKKKKKCRRLQIRKRVSFSFKNCNSRDTDSSKTANVLRKKESAIYKGKTMSLYSETRREMFVLK